MNDSAIRDPTTANCRIYVGNLKENTPKNELNNIFSKYGTIRGIMVSRNFGFIQFDSEQSVNNAIDNENQKMYNGRKITVSKVQKKSNQKLSDKGNAGGGPNEVSNQNPPNNTMLTSSGSDPMTKTSQINTNNNGNNNSNNNNNNNNGSNNNISNQNTGNNPRQNWMRNRNNNRNNNNNNEMNLHTDRERSPFDGRRDSNDRWSQDGGNSNLSNFRNNNRNNNMHRNNNMNNMSGNNTGNNAGSNASNSMGAIQGTIGMNSNNNKNSAGNVQTFSIKSEVKSVLSGGVLQGYASAREIRAKFPNANDCEIVVLERHLLDYAEFVEGRLKHGGLTADLLFPNADLTIGKMLSNISHRGSLFAVIIQPQHKENKSVTVNILYGIPSEHRNMPLEDALQLIFRNYQHLCQGENGDIIGDSAESPYASIPLANTRNPDSIQHLVNLLADNRTLTVLQLDCLLKYLQERREAQYRFELGETNVQPSTTADSETNIETVNEPVTPQVDPEKEIEKKLMEILSKPSIPNLPKPEPVKKSPEKKILPSTSNVDTAANRHQQPNLLAKDPKLRNVLDSLMLDDI